MFAIARILRGSLGYIRTHKWTWYVIGFVVVAGGAYYFGSSRIPAIHSKISQVVKSWTTTEKIIIANANVVITATGGTTNVTFDENGVPNSVTNEGGSIHIQAIIQAERKEKEKIRVASTTTSEYSESGKDPGRWGIRAGVTIGRSSMRLEGGISYRILGPFGIEVNASVPKDVQSIDEVRGGLSVTGRW